jgi:hypothetical protein
MKVFMIAAAVLLAPAVLAAQATGTAKADVHASAAGQVTPTVPSTFSAAGRAHLEATYARARQAHVPESAIQSRVAEGEAKGASEGAVVKSAATVETNMESARTAMVAAGRHPSDAEIQAGAYAMERGVTKTQIGTMAHRAPADRSLTVALDAVTQLNENGVALNSALAAVQTKLDARASDAAITSLVTQAKAGVKIGGDE